MNERLPPAATTMNDLGEHRLVELHERRAGREQGLDLLAEDAHDVAAQCLSRLVDPIRHALEPHRPREQVRTW